MTTYDPAGLPLPLSGDTRLYMIIGDPIAQVGSPQLFNPAFRRAGVRAVLFPAHVARSGLAAFLQGLRQLRNLDGIIVTVPHKIDVMAHVDRIGPNARAIGAVNVVRCMPDGAWVGDNFDGHGCVSALIASGHRLAGRQALLVGAGGAGTAVAHAMAQAGIARLRLCDPDGERVRRLAGALAVAHPALAIEQDGPDPEGFDLLVNCSPLGMRADDPLPIDPERIASGSLVVDAVLKPAISPLLERARQRGCIVQPGARMLEGQVEAVLGFFGLPAA
ncbi:shikimate dehydrogenase family protein [Marinivivus vitaminiproducens]|uniref:shikimate dehydrogenase family protein n=1 Tax=Marinivivus vitaminiproducens TaxID=3035935 RepID=UPI00279935A9|nr:shikimate dehydrogenase [Geminicoccaceae bacterium SCSIO 64248]